MSKQFLLNTRKAVQQARDSATDQTGLQSSHVQLVPAEIVAVTAGTYTVKLSANEDESELLTKIRPYNSDDTYVVGAQVHLCYPKPDAHPYIFSGGGGSGGGNAHNITDWGTVSE